MNAPCNMATLWHDRGIPVPCRAFPFAACFCVTVRIPEVVTFRRLVEEEFGPSYFILLRNFPLNGHYLTLNHLAVLKEFVAPYLRKPHGFVEIDGMTDRSGSRVATYIVGAARVTAVQVGLVHFGISPARCDNDFTRSIGEDFLEFRQRQDLRDPTFDDGRLNGRFRFAVVALSPAFFGFQTRIF
jgi:hypothetical protein